MGGGHSDDRVRSVKEGGQRSFMSFPGAWQFAKLRYGYSAHCVSLVWPMMAVVLASYGDFAEDIMVSRECDKHHPFIRNGRVHLQIASHGSNIVTVNLRYIHSLVQAIIMI